MSTYYDAVDLFWSDDGDFAIGRDGDIADTQHDPLLAVKQDVYDRVKSDKMDYLETPNIGAGLSDFIGEPNTKAQGMEIERRIFGSMRSGGGSITLGDMSVRVFPLDAHTVGIRLELRVQPTPWNRQTGLLNMNMMYAYHENNIYSVDHEPQE